MLNKHSYLKQRVFNRSMSDRQLCRFIYQNEAAALTILYDRYAPLVFRILCKCEPCAAEPLLEDVFVALWQRGRTSLITELLPLLFQLIAEVVTQHQVTEGRAVGVASRSVLLPVLHPFMLLPAPMFEVVVPVCLGKLTITELSLALECEEAVLQHTLASGFAMLRTSYAQGSA
jgi:DNA-directed RNA polymerase specialized sigma24 family protein